MCQKSNFLGCVFLCVCGFVVVVVVVFAFGGGGGVREVGFFFFFFFLLLFLFVFVLFCPTPIPRPDCHKGSATYVYGFLFNTNHRTAILYQQRTVLVETARSRWITRSKVRLDSRSL